MSLGGYKFSGYYCQKGSLSDTQWALLMHKTKVAAFMAANALANAGWDYDMTGSPDGNYHCLDSVGNNYVTVFKRTNGENDYTWFALYTLCKATKTGTDTDAAKRSLISGSLKSGSSTTLYFGTWACSFFRIGERQIAYNDSLVDLTATQNGTTPLIPMGNTGSATNYSDSGYFGMYASMLVCSTNYYGFAVKGNSVIIFQGKSYSQSDLSCSVASGNAFGTLDHGVVVINTQDIGSGSPYDESESRMRPSSSLSMPLTLCQNDEGDCVVAAPFGALPVALWTSAINAYPYQSITFYAVLTNESGVFNKGSISIDLFACNMNTSSANVPANYTIAANGNYLRIASNTSGNVGIGTINNVNIDSVRQNTMLYVGWDPSNPDITQASAWVEYTGT